MNEFIVQNWPLMLSLGLFLMGLFLGFRLAGSPRGKSRGVECRESTDYIQGMHAMLTGDTDAAIEHLSRVVEMSTEPVEVYLALGYLYRRRGQVDRAIRVHQSLLSRPNLTEEEKVLALNALGSDFRTGGFMDRASKTFREAQALDPKDAYSLEQLIKLSEDLKEWKDAYEYAVRLQKIRRHKDGRALSYLLAQKARLLGEEGASFRSAWFLRRSIRALPENMLAYIYLVKLYMRNGKSRKARRILERALRHMPYKSYMVLDLLKEVHVEAGDIDGYLQALWSLGREHHQKRALLRYLDEILDLKRLDRLPETLRTLARHFARSRVVQRRVWELTRQDLVGKDLFKDLAGTFAGNDQLTDTYTCIYCGYKTQEILHRCPNCKEWNSFSDGES